MAQLMNIAPAELEARLSSFFPSADQRTAYTDPEIDEIASLLGLLGSCAARSPRIFIVLRMIGSLNRLHELLEHGFEDVWLPVERHSLPPSFPPHVRSDFVKAQAAVLTKSINLENGRHCHFSVDEPRPFEIQRRLGSGAYSQVDMIHMRSSLKCYALKRMRRRKVFGNDTKAAMKIFLSEIDILKRVRHQHAIKFIGSYTDKSFLGILMSPVAEMDLKSFLERLCANMKASIALDGVQQEISSLRAFFGCLAASISFLHDNRIRHKDLKPQNILIAGGTVVLTDFGLSRHFTDGQGSTTSGPTSATPRYSPPEVAAQESRNTSGDIWSLGCVFVEMGAALQGVSIDNIKEIFESEGTKEINYGLNLDACKDLISNLETSSLPQDRKLWGVISPMLRYERLDRPTAAMILGELLKPSNHDEFGTLYCGICCIPSEHSDSQDSLEDELLSTNQPQSINSSRILQQRNATYTNGKTAIHLQEWSQQEMSADSSPQLPPHNTIINGTRNPTSNSEVTRSPNRNESVSLQTSESSFLTKIETIPYPERNGYLRLKGISQFIWLGNDPLPMKSLENYMRCMLGPGKHPDPIYWTSWKKLAEQALQNAAWASLTGRGLLFISSRATTADAPLQMINLAEATLSGRGEYGLRIRLNGLDFDFYAEIGSKMTSWNDAIDKACVTAISLISEIRNSHEYKNAFEKLQQGTTYLSLYDAAKERVEILEFERMELEREEGQSMERSEVIHSERIESMQKEVTGNAEKIRLENETPENKTMIGKLKKFVRQEGRIVGPRGTKMVRQKDGNWVRLEGVHPTRTQPI